MDKLVLIREVLGYTNDEDLHKDAIELLYMYATAKKEGNSMFIKGPNTHEEIIIDAK